MKEKQKKVKTDKVKKKKPKKKLLFRFLKGVIKLFYKKSKFVDLENIPNEPCIITGNHAKMHGPLMCGGYFPLNKRIWCDAPMMNRKDFPEYAINTFFGGKKGFFTRLAVWFLTPIITYVFKHADTLAVYRDMRVMSTYKESLDALEDGNHLLILPECPTPKDDIVNYFNEYFVDTARLYYKKTKKELQFVPMYYAAELRIVKFGKPIKFNASNPIDEERKRICAYLEESIYEIAKGMPEHTVIPFHAVPKDQLKKNK